MLPQNTHHHGIFFIMAILHCAEEKKEERRMIRRENRGRYYSPFHLCFTNPLSKSFIYLLVSSQQLIPIPLQSR